MGPYGWDPVVITKSLALWTHLAVCNRWILWEPMGPHGCDFILPTISVPDYDYSQARPSHLSRVLSVSPFDLFVGSSIAACLRADLHCVSWLSSAVV